MKTINVHELMAADAEQQRTDMYIDVRTPGEFAALHVASALNVPLDVCSEERLQGISGFEAAQRIVLICQSGQRAGMAFEKIKGAACADRVVILDGGTTAWQQAQGAVVTGKGVISLERQVRIAAGFLVALGAVLAYVVDPRLVGICGFVGVGLMFAGVTNFCGMGLLLARMPWNNSSSASCSV